MILAVLLISCSAPEHGSTVKDDKIKFRGTVRHVDIEGGFWGIITDGESKYFPVNLGEAYRRDGLRVRGELKLLGDRPGIRMWGEEVEIINIEKMSGPP